jgi:hypothetical protein
MNFESRDYHLPRRTTLQFFDNWNSFQVHADKHFLKYPFCRLFDASFAEQVRQQIASGQVPLLGAFYGRVFPRLEAGVRFAADLPVYIRYVALVTLDVGRKFKESGFYFLAKEGFQVGAHTGVVRTAFYTEQREGFSEFARFRDAWLRLRRHTVVDGSYYDSANRRRYDYDRRLLVFSSPANWLPHDPDPHAEPPAELLDEVDRCVRAAKKQSPPGGSPPS